MIVIDFETNSTNIGDVIEVAMYKVFLNKENNLFEISEVFHRYYHSKFPVNKYTIGVHKLSPEVLAEKRKGASYPTYFEEDFEFEEFCRKSQIVVAHNLPFEIRHINKRTTFETGICTMRGNKKTVGALNKNGKVKAPNLGEVCQHFDIDFTEDGHHSAIYDIEKTLEILNGMRAQVRLYPHR